MKNIKLTIAYDGTNYCGWQRQINGRTVQGEIEKALKKIMKKEITIHGSGRTDAGVHGLGQVASFKEDFSIPVDKIPKVINRVLPEDIVITSAVEMDFDFHARYHAKGKKYTYKIYNDKIRNPLYKNYSYFYERDVDIQRLIEASKYFIGEHDFKAFRTKGSSTTSTIREIYSIDIHKEDKMIIIEYSGNGFLYNMVRIITGTLLDVNIGKIDMNKLPEIIESGIRRRAGHKAPAQGLYLDEVYY